MRIGLLHSARMTPRVPDPVACDRGLAERDESVTVGTPGWNGFSRGRHWVEPVVRVLVVVCRSGGMPGRPWVHCCLDDTHATPSTRQDVAHTDRDPIEARESLHRGRWALQG